jgi:L-threonine kinase
MPKILASASLPGTMGEWVQGWIGGRESLVSLVTAWRGYVELRSSLEGDSFPAPGEKALRAFEISKRIFRNTDGSSLVPDYRFINVVNPLPASRGLATSTMDIAGTFAACAAFAGRDLPEEKLFALCAEIEPSDGIMFEGLALVDHINGELLERLPSPPEMRIVAVVPPRELDTAEYRRDERLLSEARTHGREHARAYDMLKRGLAAGDPELIGKASTLSAETQQKIMPRPEWEPLREALRLSGAVGIAVAHSGTASGLLYSPANKFGPELAEKWLKGVFADSADNKVTISKTISSGGGFFAERR